MGDVTALLVGLLLLLGNAFFVGAEFALVSARRTQIEPRAEAGSVGARLTLRGMEKVSLMMAGAQLGITMCSLGLGAIAEPAVAHLIEPVLAGWGIPEAGVHTVAFAIALGIVVSLHMVLGEMVPKNIAIAGPERSALALGPPLYAVVTALKPLITLLNWSANVVLRLVRVTPQDEVASTFTADEVAAFVDESRKQGLLPDARHELVSGALELAAGRVGDVVRPADELVTVRHDVTVAELQDACGRTGYSRFPVVDGADRITGYVHVKDVLDVSGDGLGEPVPPRLVRAVTTLASGDTLREALAAMQASGAHLAVVVGHGEVAGVATLEDVLKELVGEVVDPGPERT